MGETDGSNQNGGRNITGCRNGDTRCGPAPARARSVSACRQQKGRPEAALSTLACCRRAYAVATASGCGSEMLRGISTSRAMTRRWIWDVPSYSCMIFASRMSFSTGYSLMKPYPP